SRAMVGVLARVSRRTTVEWRGSWRMGLVLLLLATLLWLAYGLAFFFFLRAFVPLPPTLLPAVTAIHAFAFLVGYLAFFAPAGLRLQDAALTLLLAGLRPPPVGASPAVRARLLSNAGEAVPAPVLPAGSGTSFPTPGEPPETTEDGPEGTGD